MPAPGQRLERVADPGPQRVRRREVGDEQRPRLRLPSHHPPPPHAAVATTARSPASWQRSKPPVAGNTSPDRCGTASLSCIIRYPSRQEATWTGERCSHCNTIRFTAVPSRATNADFHIPDMIVQGHVRGAASAHSPRRPELRRLAPVAHRPLRRRRRGRRLVLGRAGPRRRLGSQDGSPPPRHRHRYDTDRSTRSQPADRHRRTARVPLDGGPANEPARRPARRQFPWTSRSHRTTSRRSERSRPSAPTPGGWVSSGSPGRRPGSCGSRPGTAINTSARPSRFER